jgi:hypothetical protein
MTVWESREWSVVQENENEKYCPSLPFVTLVLFINTAKPANPFDEEPDFDAFATLAKAACLMRAGELSRSLLVDLVSSGTESLSSADRDTE